MSELLQVAKVEERPVRENTLDTDALANLFQRGDEDEARDKLGLTEQNQPEPDSTAPEAEEASEQEPVEGDSEEVEEKVETAEGEESDEGDQLPSLKTISDVVEATGLTREEFLNAEVDYKSNGQEVTRTVADLIKRDQLYEGSEARFAEAKQMRLQYQEAARTNAEAVQTANYAVDKALKDLLGFFDYQMTSGEIAKLKDVGDPDYPLRMEEMRQVKDHFTGVHKQAADDFQAFLNERSAAWQEQQSAYIQQKIPDWTPEHLELAKEGLASFDVSPEEAPNLDGRVVVGAIELARLRKENAELKAQTEKRQATTERQIRRIRDAKPGAKVRKPRSQAQKDATSKAQIHARIHKTGSREALADLFDYQEGGPD